MQTEHEQTVETKNSPEQSSESAEDVKELHATKEGQFSERGHERLRTPEFPIKIDERTEKELLNHFERLRAEIERSTRVIDILAKIEQGGKIIIDAEPTVSSTDVERWVKQLVEGSHDATQQQYYELSKEREKLKTLTSTDELSREELSKRAKVHGIKFSGIRSRLPGLGSRHQEEVSFQVFQLEQDQIMQTYDKQKELKHEYPVSRESTKLLAEPEPALTVEGHGLQQRRYLDVEDPLEIIDSLKLLNETRQQNRLKLEAELFGEAGKVSTLITSLAELPPEEREARARTEIEKLLQLHKITIDSSKSVLTENLPRTLEGYREQIVANFGSGNFYHPSLLSENLPILYMDEQDERELQQVSDKFSEVTGGGLWGFVGGEKESGRIQAGEFIKMQRDEFFRRILLGETPFIHTSPVLERIVRSGALKPKQMVEEEQKYNNMQGVDAEGSHTNLVHFCPDTFNPYWSQFSSDKEVYRSKSDPTKMEYQGGIAVPMSEVVKNSPISMHGTEAFGVDYVAIELPEDLDSVPQELLGQISKEETRLNDPDIVTSNSGMDRSLDWAFVGSETPAEAAQYEYPISESYIFTTDLERTTADLLDQGKGEAWISEHVLHLPSDLSKFGTVGFETELSKAVAERARGSRSRRVIVVPLRRLNTIFDEGSLYQYRR